MVLLPLIVQCSYLARDRRGWSGGTRPFLKRVGALVRCPDESILPCFLPGGAREELILFPVGPGGGREGCRHAKRVP